MLAKGNKETLCKVKVYNISEAYGESLVSTSGISFEERGKLLNFLSFIMFCFLLGF